MSAPIKSDAYIGHCRRTGYKVFPSDVEGYTGVCRETNENLYAHEIHLLTPEQKQAYEDDRLLYQLGKGPNPDAVCLEPDEVNEDNEHRNCECCGAGVLFEGYVYGDIYFCTTECFKAYAAEHDDEDMKEWLALADADELTDDDLEYVYWTNWEGE